MSTSIVIPETCNLARHFLDDGLFTVPAHELDTEEAAGFAVVLKAVSDKVEARSSELRAVLVPVVKAQGEPNDTGKTFTLQVDSVSVSVTVRESNKIDEGRLRALLSEKEIPPARVYPTTSIEIVPAKKSANLDGGLGARVLEALRVAGLAAEVKLVQNQALNEKAVEGLVALGEITPEELVSVTNTTTTDALKIVGDEQFVAGIVE